MHHKQYFIVDNNQLGIINTVSFGTVVKKYACL